MSSPAAIINALDDKKSEALLYYITDHGTLAIEHRPLGQNDYQSFQDNSSPDFEGPIGEGQLAVVQHSKSLVVYGFNKTKGGKNGATRFVAQVSPVVNPLSHYDSDQTLFQDWHSLAAVTDDNGRDYIYYFKNKMVKSSATNDAAQPYPTIVEFKADVKQGAPKAVDLKGEPQEIFTGAEPTRESHLAALYDSTPVHGDRRTVFFQQKDDKKNTVYYQHTSSKAPVAIEDAYARPGSPLAVVKAPKIGSDSFIHLYYVDAGDLLKRVTRKNSEWLAPTTISDESIRQNSEVSAVWDANDNAVRLFVRLEGDANNTFIQIKDSVAPRS
ncbi:hypothetical protein G7046_g949 [Stylonectria norvegica]|nr:hypothetical protein G7046_g949 [Stylonectria norvegica]